MALAILDRFPMMQFINKATHIIIIDFESGELLHKLNENY